MDLGSFGMIFWRARGPPVELAIATTFLPPGFDCANLLVPIVPLGAELGLMDIVGLIGLSCTFEIPFAAVCPSVFLMVSCFPTAGSVLFDTPWFYEEKSIRFKIVFAVALVV